MTALWLASLWSSSVRGGAALLAAWMLCQIPRVPAVVHCWLWRAAFVVLLISFVWTTPVTLPLLRSVAGAAASRRDTAAEMKVEPGAIAAGVTPAASSDHANNELKVSIVSHLLPAPATSPSRWPIILFAAWAACLAVSIGRLALGWVNALHLRRGGTLVDLPELKDLCLRLNIRRTLSVRLHPSARTPMLIGLWRATIVLPESTADSPNLRLIVAHELAHLKRMDLLWNWLPTLAMTVLRFHPLVWIGNRQWRLATEAACDADAMAAMSIDPRAYGRFLVNLSITSSFRTSNILAVTVAAESRWLLKQRLSAMANVTRWNRRRLVSAGLIVTVFTLVAAVPWNVVGQRPVPTGQGEGGGSEEAAKNAPAPSTGPIITGLDFDNQLTKLWNDKYKSQIIFQNGKAVNEEEIKKAFNEEAARLPKQNAHDVVALGTISMPKASIRCLTAGTVERVGFNAGQSVRKGDVIVQLESKPQADAVASAMQIVKSSDEHYRHVEAQGKVGVATVADVSQAKLDVEKAKDTLQQRQAELDRMKIVAPFDGTLSSLNTSAGSTILPGDPIATVIDATAVMVEFNVPSDDAKTLKVGAPVELRVRSGDKVIGNGEMTVAGLTVDRDTGAIRFVAKLVAPNHGLAAGELVNIRYRVAD